MRMNWDPQEHYEDFRVAASYDRTQFSSLAGWAFDRLEKRALISALPARRSTTDRHVDLIAAASRPSHVSGIATPNREVPQ